MPTIVRFRRDGIPLHLHPTARNPEGRWHSAWERHPGDESAHLREDAERPAFSRNGLTMTWERAMQYGYLTSSQNRDYERALRGERFNEYVRPGRRVQSEAEIFIEGLEQGLEYAISNRAFGVEMECISNSTEFINRCTELGIRVRNAGYTHDTTPYWKIVSDSSLSYTGRRAGFHTMEVVSPVLRGTAGLLELKKVCGVLEELDSIVNRSCGMHVHHSAEDLTVATAKRLAHNYANAQSAIDKLVAVSRRSSSDPQYCHPFNVYDLQSIDSSLTIADMYSVGRYRGLNIGAAYVKHKTFEFRQHQGTVNFKKIAAWIQLGQKMIEEAANGTALDFSPSIEEMSEKLELPEYLKNFFHARAAQLVNVEA